MYSSYDDFFSLNNVLKENYQIKEKNRNPNKNKYVDVIKKTIII